MKSYQQTLSTLFLSFVCFSVQAQNCDLETTATSDTQASSVLDGEFAIAAKRDDYYYAMSNVPTSSNNLQAIKVYGIESPDTLLVAPQDVNANSITWTYYSKQYLKNKDDSKYLRTYSFNFFTVNSISDATLMYFTKYNEVYGDKSNVQYLLLKSDNTFTYNKKPGTYLKLHAYPIKAGYVRESLTDGNFGTICLAYSVSANEFTGATFYQIEGLKEANGSKEIILSKVESLEAGKPYLFQADNATLIAAYTGETTSTATEHNGLIGSLEECDVPESMYLLSDNKIVKCGMGCKIAANRAYIDLDKVPTYNPTEAPAKVYSLKVYEQSGTTSITSAVPSDTPASSVAYDIFGKKINSNTYRNVQIINNKKIFK